MPLRLFQCSRCFKLQRQLDHKEAAGIQLALEIMAEGLNLPLGAKALNPPQCNPRFEFWGRLPYPSIGYIMCPCTCCLGLIGGLSAEAWNEPGLAPPCYNVVRRQVIDGR